MDAITVVQSPKVLVACRAVGLVLLAVLLACIAGCSDEVAPTPPPPPPTQTAAAIEIDQHEVRVHAEQTATLSPRTPVPTAAADACKLLTKEEVAAAIGKPVEQTTATDTGRCSYQGDGEFLNVTLYAGMTEADAKKLFNFKYVNPSIPAGFMESMYVTGLEVDNVGDEAVMAHKPVMRPGSRREVIYVREGSQVFYVLWVTTVFDKEPEQVLTDLAKKVLPRL
jgi:hypothetical protein